MRLFRRKGLLLVLIPLLFLAGVAAAGCWLFSDRILDGVVRPRLERMAAARLQAEVHAERLVWKDGGLTLSGVTVVRADRFLFSLDRLRVMPSFRDLLRRRLTAVDLLNPAIEIFPSPSPDTGADIPPDPPLTVGRLTLRGGRFTYAHPVRPLAVQDIEFSLCGDAGFSFAGAGRVAGQSPIPFEVGGNGRWRDGVHMTLNALRWQERALLRRPVTLALPAGQAGGRLRIDLHFGRVTRADVESWLRVFHAAERLPDDADFAFDDVRVAAHWQGGILNGHLSLGRGYVSTPGIRLPLGSLGLKADLKEGLWQGGGTFALETGAGGTFDFQTGEAGARGRLALTVPDPVALQKSVLGRIVLPVAGGAEVVVEAVQAEGGPVLSFVAKGIPGRSGAAGTMFDISVLSVKGTLEKRRKDWQVGARVYLAGKPLATLAGNARKLRIEMSATPWSRLRRMLVANGRPTWLKDAQGVAAAVTLLREKAGWRADTTLQAGEVEVKPGMVRDLSFRGDLVAGGGKVRLSSGSLRAKVLHERFGETALTTRFNALQTAGNGWDVSVSSLDLGPLEIMSEDGLSGLAGGRLHLQGRVCRGSGRMAPLEMRLEGRVSAAEALLGAWYGNLGDLPLDVAAFANWHPAASRLELIDLKLDAGGLATIRANGEHRKERSSLEGTVKMTDLARSWDGRGRALLGELRPALGDLALQGGLELKLALDGGGDHWRLRGAALPKKLSVDWPRVRLVGRGIDGEIPIDLARPVGGVRWEPSASGRVSIKSLSCGPLRMDTGEVQCAAVTNGIAVENPLRLSAGGGEVSVGQLRVGYGSGGLQLETRIRLAGADLKTLTSEFGMIPMEGTISADLGHIRYTDGLLRSDGEVFVEAFGGTLRMRNLQLDPVSLGLPQLQADIAFNGIDLFLLTGTFEFGAINGVVDGEVKGLRLYGATPSHFSAWLETRPGGRRNISVKALNNLSILSQGGLSAALSRGIYKFIDFYRYRRIGIRCELAEDVFILRGTAREDGRHYLVDGGVLPPRIDIIAPDRPISFREMLRRLKRLDRTGRGSD